MGWAGFGQDDQFIIFYIWEVRNRVKYVVTLLNIQINLKPTEYNNKKGRLIPKLECYVTVIIQNNLTILQSNLQI